MPPILCHRIKAFAIKACLLSIKIQIWPTINSLAKNLIRNKRRQSNLNIYVHKKENLSDLGRALRNQVNFLNQLSI